MEKENILGTEKIGKLLLTYSVPGVISMLVNSIYNMVDQIFIGRGVGYLGNGATTVSFPFVQLLLALSIMTAAGTAANAGLNLGRKDQRKADSFVGSGFGLSLFWGLMLLIVGEIFMVPMLNFFGATPDNLSYAIDYSRIILIGFPFVTTSMMMNDIIRADGAPRFAMISMLAGAIANIILDPIFIFVCHWGVKGAALATIIGQIISCGLSLYRFRKLRTLTFRPADTAPDFSRLKMICIIGMSAFLTQMANLVSRIILNNQAAKYGLLSVYGADIPVTCFGITMKIVSLMMSMIIGITNATQPIFAFNFGAHKYDRVRELVKKTALTTIVMGCFGWIFFQTCPALIISLFGQESELYNEFGVMCLRNMTLTIFVMGIPMLAGVYFQSVGKPMQAVVLSLSRQIIFLIPIILLLPLFIGLRGVMYAYPISDIFSIILSVALFTRELKLLRELQAKEA
ncbi:MAG: MATE family efflux transporter [Clostridiales bacterium]|nr:MATE family efflux transporter [Candidatus Blautia equi]